MSYSNSLQKSSIKHYMQIEVELKKLQIVNVIPAGTQCSILLKIGSQYIETDKYQFLSNTREILFQNEILYLTTTIYENLRKKNFENKIAYLDIKFINSNNEYIIGTVSIDLGFHANSKIQSKVYNKSFGQSNIQKGKLLFRLKALLSEETQYEEARKLSISRVKEERIDSSYIFSTTTTNNQQEQDKMSVNRSQNSSHDGIQQIKRYNIHKSKNLINQNNYQNKKTKTLTPVDKKKKTTPSPNRFWDISQNYKVIRKEFTDPYSNPQIHLSQQQQKFQSTSRNKSNKSNNSTKQIKSKYHQNFKNSSKLYNQEYTNKLKEANKQIELLKQQLNKNQGTLKLFNRGNKQKRVIKKPINIQKEIQESNSSSNSFDKYLISAESNNKQVQQFQQDFGQTESEELKKYLQIQQYSKNKLENNTLFENDYNDNKFTLPNDLVEQIKKLNINNQNDKFSSSKKSETMKQTIKKKNQMNHKDDIESQVNFQDLYIEALVEQQKNEISNLKEENNVQKQQIKSLQTENIQQKQQIEFLNLTLTQYKECKDQQKQEDNDYESKNILHDLLSEKQQFEQQQSLQKQIKILESENEKLQNELLNYKKTFEENLQVVQELKSQQTNVKDLESQILELQQKNEKLENVNQETLNLTQQQQEKVNTKKLKLQKSKENLNEVNSQLLQIQKEKFEFQQQIENSQKEIAEFNKQIEILKTNIENKEQTIVELQKNLTEVQQQIQNTTNDHQILSNSQYEEYQAKLAVMEDMKTQKNILEKQVCLLHQQAEQSQSLEKQKIENLENEIQTKQQMIENLELQNSEQKKETDQIKEQLLQEQLKFQEQEINLRNSEVNLNKQYELEQKISQITQENLDFNGKLNDFSKLQTDLTEITSKNNELELKIHQLQDESQQLKIQNEQVLLENKSFQLKIDLLNEEIKELQEKIRNGQGQQDTANKRLSGKESQFELDLQDFQNFQIEDEKVQLENQLAQLSEKLDRKKKKIDALKQQIAIITTSTLKDSKESNDPYDSSTSNNDKRQSLNNLRKQNSDINLILVSQENRIQKYSIQIQKLQKHNEELKQLNEELQNQLLIHEQSNSRDAKVKLTEVTKNYEVSQEQLETKIKENTEYIEHINYLEQQKINYTNQLKDQQEFIHQLEKSEQMNKNLQEDLTQEKIKVATILNILFEEGQSDLLDMIENQIITS